MSRLCCVCEKVVYAVEELKALSKVYHKTCFRCGGKAKDGCNKKLALSDYVEHDNEPYCKYCHSKLFGTSAHRQGMINSTPLDKNINKSDGKVLQEEPSMKTNPFLEKDKVRRASLGEKEAPKASKAGSVPASAPQISSTIQNPCALCGKTVYHVEQLKALGVIWHRRCFKCSGTNGDGCLKVVSLTNYVDHNGMPYCGNCHTKLFGPKGSNARLGNSIAHVNDTVKQESDSVVVESEEPKDKNLASAISNLKVVEEAPSTKQEKSSPQLLDAVENSVFNATLGDASPKRRSSLKVGGNLKNEVHKEVGYVGDNDEVDEDEWS